MKRVGFLVAMSVIVLLPLGEHRAVSHLVANSPFDEYGKICWNDERARLDNFAIQLQNSNRTTLGHIIVYDEKHSCRGEAVARAIRAKKYLVEYRGVEADRVIWRWGGYQTDMRTTLVIHPAGASIWPFAPSLPLEEVTFVGNCYRKVRPVKCRKW